MSTNPENDNLITRREAIRRVSALLGGIALVGGSSLLTGCRPDGQRGSVSFTADDIAFLDEVADTILPETSSPGAKAAQTGAFMALMVTDSYEEPDQQVFRDGMRTLDERCREMHGHSFMESSPQERLALLEELDREQVEYTRSRQDARRRRSEEPAVVDTPQAEAHLPDQRQQAAIGTESSGAVAITADSPSHYFRMMKELAMLGYFTSEIGYNQAMRYVESPGRYDPCVPYEQGERAWAPHA
ncbi:MAG TPA: gluconate 2-dehydrogenase subunit 3 family protein [Gemmatimonadaceae bacterium]|nr:gluconate 2-dehydrogenase subunit 3 family protein [Gemmatimonadaceae bacterium]